MKKNSIFTGVCLVMMIICFFLGYSYALREFNIESYQDNDIYIDMEYTRKGLYVPQLPENIFFRINGEVSNGGEIPIK